MEISNKNILITGASGGIGSAIAQALAEAGARILLSGRNEKALLEIKNQLPHAEKHSIVVADISTEAGRATLRNYCAEDKNSIDILINNAGISEFMFLENQESSAIENIIHTNLIAPVLLTQSLLPLLKEKPQAAIINIGSSFGSIGYPGFSAYCASKFGLRGFTEALRRELSDSSIKVFYLAPRATNTAINKSNVVAMNQKLGNATDESEVVAQALLNMLTKPSAFEAFIGWPEKLFVRVNAVLPSLVDSALKKQLDTIRDFANPKR